jgi:hypothetical protein
MSSFQQSAAALIDERLNLIALLRELERLRERVRKAELARWPRVDRRKRTRIRRLELRRRFAAAKSIRKSSICFPDLSCAVSQRGFIPGSAVADHSLTSMTLHSSILAKWVALTGNGLRCVRSAISNHGQLAQ